MVKRLDCQVRSGRRGRARSLTIAAAVLAGASAAQAQIATLDKGHNLLVNNGLQVWGLVTDANYQFNYANMAAANFNAVTWSYGASSPQLLSAGQKWGRWVDHTGHPSTALTPTEQSKIADLVTLQVGDEQQGDLENPNGFTRAWFQAEHGPGGPYFPNQLLTVNSFFINSDVAYADFIAAANPDAIAWDGYPFTNPPGVLITPTNWLVNANRFRRHGMGSYIGATGNSPRPYGMYLQTYHASDGARDPSDVEMRWQQFVAWTLGYKFVNTFTAGGGNTSLFVSGNQNLPNEPYYSHFKETARQGRNLGPALTRLISYGYGPSIVLGKDANGNTNLMPGEWLTFAPGNAPPNQQYLSSISAVNTGTKNNGHAGDVYVGFFNPLHTSYGDPAGEVYFMVTNGLGGNAGDPVGLVSEYQQQITLNFDMGHTTINSLQRLRRSDGVVETIPLTHLSGTTWRAIINLEGGTGDLFKYNDGYPFVGAEAVQPTVYWDNDANAGNNNTTTGAGLGGTGNWDSISNKWYNGASNGTWQSNRNPVFWGTGGTISIVSPPSVSSMTFKSNGYLIQNSSISLLRPFISVDSGVTATISSALSGGIGLVKNGGGTLVLTGSNNYIGGSTINEGVLQVSTDAGLGSAPSTLQTNISLNGGTLRFGANFDINNNRAIALGPGGGTIDTNGFSNPSGYNATAGGFRGPGDLTKIGAGTFYASAPTGGANTTWKGKLIIKEGTWKIFASDGLPYNVPAGDGLQPAQVTLDGGTWQMAATRSITNALRGITVTGNGGTIDTQGFDLTWAGPMAGSVTTANLNKIGTGILRFTGVGTASTYNGIVNVNQGTLRLDNGITMGDLASINVAGGAVLNVTAAETIGSLAGNGNVTLTGSTLTTGGNNSSTTFGGSISGGALTKTGVGTMTLSGANTYTGATTVNGGTLVLAQSLTTSSSLTVATGANAQLAQHGSRVIKTGSVNLSGTGKLDLKNNKAIITAQSGGVGSWNGTAYTGVTGLVDAGRGNGTWNGTTGIRTSMPDAMTGLTTLAVATAGQVGYTGQTFAGVTVNANDVLVMYTWGGDAELDGDLDGDDYFWIDSNVGNSGSVFGFHFGDFDYDGDIDGDDYFIIDSNLAFAQTQPNFPTSSGAPASGGLQTVPEPGAAGAAGLLTLVAGMRRRRNAKIPLAQSE